MKLGDSRVLDRPAGFSCSHTATEHTLHATYRSTIGRPIEQERVERINREEAIAIESHDPAHADADDAEEGGGAGGEGHEIAVFRRADTKYRIINVDFSFRFVHLPTELVLWPRRCHRTN